ncbi:hypothetical protein Anas_03592 [Armadillidium nasatum]|uniref:BTB domain-containing protein n=1 Tax=Armadillidium nasatum TaxID=96803 RepID=A0A5N5STH6_9CRUS|nr:hypothetical protein Anas_03592 [Armadillidium nasatum]
MANWSTQAATRGQFADITIRVGEGKDTTTFKAHRLLLATASQPLNKLVTSNNNNGPSGDGVILHVTDIDPESFQHILKYIYTDDLEVCSVSESIALVKMGKKWDLPKLLERTVKYLDSFLNEYEPISEDRKNELCDLVVLSEEQGLELINKKSWSVLMKHVNDVVPCQGFLNMTKDMIRKLLTHPDFKFKNQLVLFEAIRDWGMNQVLQQNLSVNSLQGLIGEFLQYVDFKAINDVDFLDTILPTDVLGKGELIAFFMTRGLEIPRDLAYNNNIRMFKEHELRFRVDKRLRLLGVGFGFLFSNTDMGITVHCQGPWETRQWRDIIQTYCRVTYEKMKTADVRLMFSEPVIIEPNHSYKILVRVSRMSAGSHDCDLWGGAQGFSRVKMPDAEFSFLKAAVDPKKEVEDSDTENKPGMITDLFYELDDESSDKKTFRSLRQDNEIYSPKSPSTPKIKKEETAASPKHKHVNENPFDQSFRNKLESTSDDKDLTNSYTYNRNESEVEDTSPTNSLPKKKKSYAEEASSYYLVNKPSSIRGSSTVPSFLRPRQPSVERSKPAWQIPIRSRTSGTIAASTTTTSRASREPSTNRESSTVRDTGLLSRRPSKYSSNLYDNSPLSKYNYGVSSIKSKFDTTSPSSSYSSRRGYETTTNSNPYSKWSSSTTSRYGTSTLNTSDSPIGNASRSTRYTPKHSDTKYDTPDTTSYSKYGSLSSSSRLGRERAPAPSPSRVLSPPSTYRRNQVTNSTPNSEDTLNRSSGTSSPISTSRYTSSTIGSPRTTSRYGASGISSLGSSRYGTDTSTGTSSSRTSDIKDSETPSSTYSSSRYGASRYGLSSSSNPTSSSTLESRHGSSTLSSTPSYLSSSSRFGTKSPVFSSRFGSSIYRR